MATLSQSCNTCLEATIPHCSDAYTICGVLTADTDYWSVITDRFGKKHVVSGTTDADGVWTIDPLDYPDGFFSQHGGTKTLQFYSDANLCDIVTLSIGDPAVEYTCISLKVEEHSDTYETWDVLCLCEAVVAPTYYNYRLYIDTKEYGMGNQIDTVTIDGTDYSVAGLVVDSTVIAQSLHDSLVAHGVNVDTFYTYGVGGGAGEVAFGVAIQSQHTIKLTWNPDNGGPLQEYFLQESTQITTDLCTTVTGDITVDALVNYSFLFPTNTGGETTYVGTSGMFTQVQYIDSDIAQLTNSIIPYASGTFFPTYTVTQNGADYTITMSNFYLPLTQVTTTGNTQTYSVC